MKKTALALILALCLTGTAALAEPISFSGTVETGATLPVYAYAGGTAEEVPVRAGETVTADTVIARIRTTKVFAEEDGTVAAVFGQAGDNAETVANRYGAVMYLEGTYRLSISASISKAYDAPENDLVHPGEKVFLVSRAHTNMKGEGMVTLVDGSSYTVLVTEGDFLVGDNMGIYRDSGYTQATCIGRGNIERVSPTAVTGTGNIVSFAVQAGDTVKRGQLLFETVSGDFDGPEAVSAEIRAGTDGVIAELNVEKGSSVTAGSVAAVIYPAGTAWVRADVAEADLKELSVGQRMKVELDWNQDLGVSYEGRVEMISALGTQGEESVTYPVYVSFVPDENTRYGMTALVTTAADGTESAGDEAGTEEPEKTPEEATEGAPEDAGKDGPAGRRH